VVVQALGTEQQQQQQLQPSSRLLQGIVATGLSGGPGWITVSLVQQLSCSAEAAVLRPYRRWCNPEGGEREKLKGCSTLALWVPLAEGDW